MSENAGPDTLRAFADRCGRGMMANKMREHAIAWEQERADCEALRERIRLLEQARPWVQKIYDAATGVVESREVGEDQELVAVTILEWANTALENMPAPAPKEGGVT